MALYTKAIFSWSSALQSFLSPQDGRAPKKSATFPEPFLRTGPRLSTANGTVTAKIRCTVTSFLRTYTRENSGGPLRGPNKIVKLLSPQVAKKGTILAFFLKKKSFQTLVFFKKNKKNWQPEGGI